VLPVTDRTVELVQGGQLVHRRGDLRVSHRHQPDCNPVGAAAADAYAGVRARTGEPRTILCEVTQAGNRTASKTVDQG
jgi:hypothetical protein